VATRLHLAKNRPDTNTFYNAATTLFEGATTSNMQFNGNHQGNNDLGSIANTVGFVNI
jgi:hypothetical protein